MQVSWIDPKDIKDFLAQLQGPLKAPAEMAWEVHTLPVEPLPAPTAQPILGEGDYELPKPAPTPPPPLPPDLPLSDGPAGPVKSEIWNIREQLRSLREIADESGMLGAAPPAEPSSARASSSLTASLALKAEARSFAEAEADEFHALPVEAPLSSVLAEALGAPPQARPNPPPRVEPEVIFTCDEPPLTAEEPISPTPAPVIEEPSAKAEETPTRLDGPQPEAPPFADPRSLPPPFQPPPSVEPPRIEYSGPAPSDVSASPLFSSSSTQTAPAPAPLSPEEVMSEKLAEALETVSLASLDTPPEVEPATSEPLAFVPPALGLSDRIGALAHWAIARLGTDEVLLVDDYGDVLWGGNQHTALVLAAMMAWHSAQRANAESACTEPERIDKELAPDRHLTVIPVRTRYGNVSLAVISNASLSEPEALAVRDALRLAVEGT